ncbi:hypothetical protein MCERH10_02431 [Caulobacteraceae bacterium]
MSTNVNPSEARDAGSSLYIGARRSLLPHGGKRVAKAATETLSKSQVRAVIGGASRSIALGVPLNRFVTVHWGALLVSERDSFKVTQDLLRHARDWLRDNGAAVAWVWVRETSLKEPEKGAHVHWLLHVPERLREAFLKRLRGWVMASVGQGVRYQTDAVHSRSVGLVGCEVRAPETHRANLRAVVGYMVKEMAVCDSKIASEGLSGIWAGVGTESLKCESGGLVSGKRAGRSKAMKQIEGC